MACVEKIKCPECGHNSLQVFYEEDKDSYGSYCFGECRKQMGNPYEGEDAPKPPKPKSDEEVKQEVQDIRKAPIFRGLGKDKSWRGIPGNAFASWGCRLLVSEYDGVTPYAVAFPVAKGKKLLGWKVRTLAGKTMWNVGKLKGETVDPFGMARAMRAGGRRLYVTEGEYDAVALDYILRVYEEEKYRKKAVAVVSLPNGVDSADKTMVRLSNLGADERFDDIILVFDADKPGKDAEEAAQAVIPTVLVADKPYGIKDPNEALEKGKGKEMHHLARWKAHKPPIEGVVRVSDVMNEVIKPVEAGLPYPWPTITEHLKGQVLGSTVAVGAGVGLGKTTMAHQIAADNIQNHGAPVFMALLEEQNTNTIRNVAGRMDRAIYHNPSVAYDQDQFMTTVESLQDKLLMWKSSGDHAGRFDMEEIIKAVRFNHAEFGVEHAFIDNATRLVDHMTARDANEAINKFSSELEALAAQLGIYIMLFSHLNPPAKGQVPHEAGGPVYTSQFTGSRGIMRSFGGILSFRRRKEYQEGDGTDPNKSIITTLKNRNFGSEGEGEVKTYYNQQTGRIEESWWDGNLIPEQEM